MADQLLPLGLLLVVLGLLLRVLYWRVPRNVSYIREGLGKRQVMLKGGGLVIPGLHRISSMELGSFTFRIAAVRKKSVLTSDPLRVDIEADLLVRIKPDDKSILMVREIFDGEVDKIRAALEERCYLVVRSVTSEFILENLLRRSADFELRLNAALSAELSEFGIDVVLCSINSLEQTSQLDYQRHKSMDAKALAVLESIYSDNVGKLHAKLKETELQIKKLDYDATIKTLEWEEQLTRARLEHRRHKAELEARLASEIKEIEVSRQMALEMIEKDINTVRLQYQLA